MKYKKILILLFVALFLSSFAFVNDVIASTNSVNGYVGVIDKHGSSFGTGNLVQVTGGYQGWRVDFSGSYQGYGSFGPSGGKYGIDLCISDSGIMWTGSCWTVVDPNGSGNIGDNSGSISGSRDIGSTSNNFTYAVAGYYVNDARMDPTMTLYGRQVSINGLNTTNSTVGIGQDFDVTWDASETFNNATVLSWSGPATCEGSGSPLSVAPNGPGSGVTCRGSSAGTINFTLTTTGYSSGGDKTVSDNLSVNVNPGFTDLNFYVKEQNNQPVNGATIIIDQNFGNGTTRNTDGVGFANFGVNKNVTINYSVSRSDCNTVNGTVAVGSGTTNVNVSLNCTNAGGGDPPVRQNAVGEIEGTSNCTAITGIAADPDDITQSIDVYLFIDKDAYAPPVGAGFVGGPFKANILRTDNFITKYGISGNYGFSIPTPSAFKDGLTHAIYVHPFDLGGTGPNKAIAGSGTITLNCPPVTITSPALQNVTISSPSVTPNGSTHYTINVISNDPGGGSKINSQYALINLSTGNERGLLTWNATDPLSGQKNSMACSSGGGRGAILSAAPTHNFYGHQYIDLVDCRNTVSGNTRTTTFEITINPLYITPLINNDIGGLVYNTDGNNDGWRNFDINFSLNMPSITSATINPKPITANGSTQYTISVVGSDPSGGTNIASQRTLINTAGPYRGYVGWSNSTWGGVQKDEKSCSGGGFGAILITAGSYGDQYLNLVSCSTSVSGNTRTTNFVVTFTPLFTTPTTGNIVSGWLQNLFSHIANWTAGQSFDLNVPIPGQCGTADGKTYASTVTAYAPDTQCTAGTPSTTAFPAQGTTQPWTCSGVNGGPSSPQCSASRNLPGAPVVTLSASPTSVTSGNSSTLTWTVTGSVTSCTASGDWSGAKSTSGGSQSTGALASTKTYNLSCTGPGGTGIAPPVTVTVGAATFSVSVTANPGPGGSIRSSEAPVPVIDTKVCGNPCTKNYTVGSTVTLKAIPNSSYWKFTSWVGGSCDSQSGDTCDINVSSNRSATAIFTPRLFIYREF